MSQLLMIHRVFKYFNIFKLFTLRSLKSEKCCMSFCSIRFSYSTHPSFLLHTHTNTNKLSLPYMHTHLSSEWCLLENSCCPMARGERARTIWPAGSRACARLELELLWCGEKMVRGKRAVRGNLKSLREKSSTQTNAKQLNCLRFDVCE